MTREEIRALEDRADETKEDVKPDPDVCRWRASRNIERLTSPLHLIDGDSKAGHQIPFEWFYRDGFCFCPYCGKRIEVVGEKENGE